MYRCPKMDQSSSSPRPPHVLVFPLPLQGPIKSMIKLAELLCIAGIQVTFLNTARSHRLLLDSSDIAAHFSRYPNFTFQTISDGLSLDKPVTGDRFMELYESLESFTAPLLRGMLISGSLSSGQPITCIISEACFNFPLFVAEEVGIPLIYFETISPSCLWTYFSVHRLIEAGEIPFTDNDLDKPIKSVPGMECFLRRRDLPSYYRASDLNDPGIQFVIRETQLIPRSYGLILNTFEGLDGPIVSRIIQSHCPNIYTIGPLHTHLKEKLATPTSSTNMWKEDRSCITWLDAQPPKSVIYFSIGSLNVMTQDQKMEFWHGIVNSGKRFLWVRRPDSIIDGFPEFNVPKELLQATKERGCVVTWAPQMEVLAHSSIGGFLTHSGWNSTLESIVEGVPMLCWPHYVDQQVDARFVSEVWKNGIDMKDTCDRVLIEKYIRDLMDVKKAEFVERADQLAKLAKDSVREGGSSFGNLNRLIDDIRSMGQSQSSRVV